jgi:hypothetical protein
MRYLCALSVVLFVPFCSWAILPISGSPVVCQYSITALTDATGGGTWSSSNTAIATVGTSGAVSGLLPGTATITYSVSPSYVTLTVTVNPTPVLTSILTPPAICDSTIFSYIPSGSPSGATFAWHRAYVPGVPLPAGGGMDNPDEQLINTTNFPIAITYTYTLSRGGCSSTADVTVTVNPTPLLSSPVTSTVCSGAIFNYIPSSITPGTTYSWARSTISGISPAGTSGTGGINETLTNSMPFPILDIYHIALTANGCTHTEDMQLTIQVLPNAGAITGSDTVCAGSIIYLSDSISGGSWHSDFPSATVSASGVVTGVFSGTDVIQYSVTNMCGTTTTTHDLVVDSCGGVSVQQASLIPGNIYPDPSTGVFTVFVPTVTTLTVTLTITNVTGAVVKSVVTTTNTPTEIGIDAPSGIYFLSATTAQERYYSRIVIKR